MARRVDLKDQTPLIIKQEDLKNGSCAVCRCGLSGHWPMCDGTHKATIGEEPGKLYRYEREMPQGTIKRHEVGEVGMPGQKEPDPTVAELEGAQAGQHAGAGEHRGRRPDRGVTAEGSRGNTGADRAGQAGDELLSGAAAAEVTEGALATGGAEAVLPGGKNRSGQGGESA